MLYKISLRLSAIVEVKSRTLGRLRYTLSPAVPGKDCAAPCRGVPETTVQGPHLFNTAHFNFHV